MYDLTDTIQTTWRTRPELSFVDLKLFVANAYSNANALANLAKPMH